MQTISQAGVDFIKSFEGYHRALPNGDCTTYYCPAGVLTIGYGSTNMDGGERFAPGAVWTREKAKARLRESLAKNYEPSVRAELAKRGLAATQAQYDMLVSFCYNCGAGNLARLMSRGTIQGIADALLLFVRAQGGGPLPGLVRRRNDERRIFLYGYRPSMPQAVNEATRKDLKQAVKKYSLKARVSEYVRLALASIGGIFTTGNLMLAKDTADQIKTFASDYWLPLLTVVGLLAWFGLKWYETRQVDDLAKGSSIPSGLANDNHKESSGTSDVEAA